VGPRAGLDGVEKRKFLTLVGLELQPLGHPAHSQLLYQIHYPGSLLFIYAYLKIDFDDSNGQRGGRPVLVHNHVKSHEILPVLSPIGATAVRTEYSDINSI
jgi:hypothetical protein